MKEYMKNDPEVWEAILKEETRQKEGIELIASENFASKAVRAAQGSVLTNKYAEGYPYKRYYGGTENVDKIESLAIERLKTLFNAEYANVQPHSGSQANAAVYAAFLNPGDKVLGMDLNAGGHLTHGSQVNFSGKLYNFKNYGLNSETELLDYDEIMQLAKEFKPKMIVAGASAYSRIIDFKKFRDIADAVGAYLMVDMAHIAGLVAAGLHPNPVEYADVVTSTTHKTLRGPRGGIILAKEKYAKQINSAVFPGTQGGPLEHVIAAKAIAFGEALTPEFKQYQKQIILNAQSMCDVFKQSENIRVIAGGTDNHLFNLDLTNTGLTGKDAQLLLDKVGITTNKEAIPNEPRSPFITSGIRIGTPAVTTRGMKENDMKIIAEFIINAIQNHDDEAVLQEIKKKVVDFASSFPYEQ